MCAFVEILAVTKYWRKQVETRQNRRYITVPGVPNTTIQVVSPKKIILQSPNLTK